MKKIFALMLALLMTLTGISALADAQTVYVKATVNADLLSSVMAMTGAGNVEGLVPVCKLINALGFTAVMEDNAGQLNIDLNGEPLASVGGKVADSGVVIGSDLFPSYVLTLSQETINTFMEQMASQMPGGNIDFEALAAKLTGYVGEFAMTLQTAVTPGEPTADTMKVDIYEFDTRTPQYVDVKAIAEAEKKMVSDILSDETIVSLLQASGQNINPDEIIQQNAQFMSEEYLPDVTVDVYTNSMSPEIYYTVSEATYKGAAQAAYRFTMLNSGTGKIRLTFDIVEQNMTITMDVTDDGFTLALTSNGMYIAGLAVTGKSDAGRTDVTIDVYVLNQNMSALNLNISSYRGGEITLQLDPEKQQAITIEDIQNNTVDEAVTEGLQNEFLPNVQTMLMKIGSAVPEMQSMIMEALQSMGN